MADDYAGPVRLQRKIPWGKRDRATGFAVLQHMVDANPPTVIPWSIHTKKLKRALRHDDVFDIGAAELEDLVVRRSSHHHEHIAPDPIPPLVRRMAMRDLTRAIFPVEYTIDELGKPHLDVQRTAPGT